MSLRPPASRTSWLATVGRGSSSRRWLPPLVLILTVLVASLTLGRALWPGAATPRVDLVGLQDGMFAYPFIRNLVWTELLDSGYYTRSHGFRVQPSCERIATLDQAKTATVRWWEQRQAEEPRLCAALVAVCRRLSIPLTGGGG